MSEGGSGQGGRPIDDRGPKLNSDIVREQLGEVLLGAEDKFGIELEGALDIERQGSDLIERISHGEYRVGIPRREPQGWHLGLFNKKGDIHTAVFAYHTGNEPPQKPAITVKIDRNPRIGLTFSIIDKRKPTESGSDLNHKLGGTYDGLYYRGRIKEGLLFFPRTGAISKDTGREVSLGEFGQAHMYAVRGFMDEIAASLVKK